MDRFLPVFVLFFCCTGLVWGRFPYPYESRRTVRYIPRANQPDPGQPLVLTPYIQSGDTAQGREDSVIVLVSMY